MKTTTRLGLTAVVLTGMLTGCAFGGGGSPEANTGTPTGPVSITFQSLAYQPLAVAATKDIVDSWNAANPDIQVNVVQSSYNQVHDQLVTQFQGGTAPDVIHNEASDIPGFAQQGYLADLTPYLTDSLKNSIPKELWKTVTTPDNKIIGIPTITAPYAVFANKDAFAKAGVPLPSAGEYSWDQLQADAKKLTGDGKYGVGFGLRQPTAAMMNLALGYDGTYFDVADDGSAKINVGDNEVAVPEKIRAMAFEDKSLDPITMTQNGTDVVPGFLAGRYGMFIGSSGLGQQIGAAAPAGFNWTVLPGLAGTAGPKQAGNPQTLSISAQSKYPAQAAKFIDYYMQAQNLAKIGEGNWLIPSTADAQKALEEAPTTKTGWKELLGAGTEFVYAPFLATTNYPQWKNQAATPTLQKYFANSITTDELKKQLTDGWNSLR